MTNKNIAFIKSGDVITIFIDGSPKAVDRTHANYNLILDALKNEEFDKIPDLVDVRKAIQAFSGNNFSFKEGVFYYKEQYLDNCITRRIIKMMEEGFKATPMIKFLDNLLANPSYTSTKELYEFLEKHDLPITDDGCFLAYKKVRPDFKDIHSGKFDNSPGQVVEMPRNLVDDNRNNTCSTGLHFCSREYLGHFGGSDSKVVILKINPMDVVSIPKDYNNTKGRCCKYIVLCELEAAKKEDLEKSVLSR